MFTIGAFDEDRASAVDTLEELDAEDDDHIKVADGDIYVPELNKLVGVYALHGHHEVGKPLTCRITSPSLRAVWPLDIARCSGAAGVMDDSSIAMFPEDPIPLVAGEAISALMTNEAVVNSRGIVGLFFADGALRPVHGEIRTLAFTSTLTGTAHTWTSGPLEAAQNLPVGRYQLVGARVIEHECPGIFRFILTGYSWRPGGIITYRERMSDYDWFRRGKLGVWGEFREFQLPRLEVLSPPAVLNPVVYLDLIKVA